MSNDRMASARHVATRMALALAGALAATTTAWAHHPTGGRLPASFVDGLLSGIGHPVIGPDHLAFIVAIGIAAALVGSGPALIGGFVAASATGVLIHAAALDIPLTEQIVALSVIVAGALIALHGAGRLSHWLPLAMVAGLFHGYAFGEAIVGAEKAVIGAYLIGIAIVASVIAISVMQVSLTVLERTKPSGVHAHARTAGIILGCVGVVMLAGSLGIAG